MSGQHLLKTLSGIFYVATGNVHLTETKVRKNVATVSKLGSLERREGGRERERERERENCIIRIVSHKM